MKHDQKISIHAPVKGATGGTENIIIDVTISIHAPVKGATRRITTRGRRDWNISIHAPVKGATPYPGYCQYR